MSHFKCITQQVKNIKPSNKVIKYACGNNYVIDMERCLFPKEDTSITYYQKELDEVWYVPQQGNHNHHYYMSLHNLPADKVKPVPPSDVVKLYKPVPSSVAR